MTELEQAYLAHHGILGQKWGRRNGPPYPLDESDHSAAEKKDLSKSLSGKRHEEMYGRNQKGNSEKSEKKDFHLTDKQKKYIKIGAAVAGVALVTAGGIYLAKTGKLDNLSKLVKNGKGAADDVLRAGSDKIDDVAKTASNAISKLYDKNRAEQISGFTGFKIKEKAGTLAENIAVNDGKYKGGLNDPLRNNCSHSVVAWILNEIGLDVKAKPMSSEFIDGGITPNEFKRFFRGSSYTSYEPKGTTIDEVKKELKQYILKQENGVDGAGAWALRTQKGGHFMGWKIEASDVIFTNPQPESLDCDNWFADIADGLLWGDGKISVFSRLDNLPPNLKYIKTACKNAL